ncbi:Protein PLASTID MOVEMENT IMPAIRED 1 [Linum grandiflorum]
MAASSSARRNSNTQLLEELETLSQSLYQAHTSSRRTNSLALPRDSLPSLTSSTHGDQQPFSTAAKSDITRSASRPRSRRMSLSPWRSKPKLDDFDDNNSITSSSSSRTAVQKLMNKPDGKKEEKVEKKGIWNWKPIRALSHIGMQKLSCLFSVEVVAVQGLPSSMNGLRLSVCVRKQETKDGSVHTMPSRVSQGGADFEETLFLKCHVYCTSSANNKQLKFEPRVFYIYVFAVDAEELDFGRSSVDLSDLIQESMEKNLQGTRIRQWDTTFTLAGKAKGAEVVLKLGFQVMEKDGGIDIYSSQVAGSSSEGLKGSKVKSFLPSVGRRQSKMSFSVTSPRITSRAEAWTPSQTRTPADLQGIDDLNLDEPPVAAVVVPPSSSSQEQSSQEQKMEDVDLPEFEVVYKGVEKEEESDGDGDYSVENLEEEKSVASSEVVKEVVHDQVHLNRLSALDSIAQQIKALESMMREEKSENAEDESESQKLDEDEDKVTKEFLQMLEDEEEGNEFKFKFNQPEVPQLHLDHEDGNDSAEVDSKGYISDLGKGLGCVVQTRDGGYLAAMNPLDAVVTRKETPKLAMQLSKPLVLAPNQSSISGFELFQKMAAVGHEELSSQILSQMSLDELTGKTAEQVAFEGIASAIIQGRNKEVATSTAARTITSVKTMANALSFGRKDRISTGIWNVSEEPLTAEEVIAFSLQKIEAMAIEALRIQAAMAEEDAPFDVSPLPGKTANQNQPLASAIPLEDWLRKSDNESAETDAITIAVCVQLRDPLRRYEAVGGPVMALIHGSKAEINDRYEEEKKFKVKSLHLGGLKISTKGKRNAFDTERQRLTAMQWLVSYGMAKGGKKGKLASGKEQDVLWSISSRIMADMWLKSMRNPDVKLLVK